MWPLENCTLVGVLLYLTSMAGAFWGDRKENSRYNYKNWRWTTYRCYELCWIFNKVMLCTSEFNCSWLLVWQCFSWTYVWLQNWTMVVDCTLITGLEFDMFSKSIAKILGVTLWSVWLFLHFCFVLFCFAVFCLFVCSFLLLLLLSFVVKLNVLATLVQNPSFK